MLHELWSAVSSQLDTSSEIPVQLQDYRPVCLLDIAGTVSRAVWESVEWEVLHGVSEGV